MKPWRYIAASGCALSCAIFVACSGGGGGGTAVGPQPPASQPSVLPQNLPTPPPAPTPTPQPFPTSRIIGAPTFPIGNTAAGGQGTTVDGVPCNEAVFTYHVHAHVSLFNHGTQVAMPVAFGIMNPVFSKDGKVALSGTCIYHLHTHDRTGLIHIENKTVETFTLGEVFDIWGEPLSRTNVAGFTGTLLVYVAQCAAPRVEPFVCGQPTIYTGDPRNIVLTQHEQITLEMGPPYVWPPYYEWLV